VVVKKEKSRKIMKSHWYVLGLTGKEIKNQWQETSCWGKRELLCEGMKNWGVFVLAFEFRKKRRLFT